MILGSNNNLITIYPNPSSDLLHIKGINGSFTGTIMNLAGQKIKEFQSPRIDISRLKPGTYLLKIDQENNVITQRVQIEH